MKPAPLIAACCVALGAFAATASAHPASAVCNPAGGDAIVTANPYTYTSGGNTITATVEVIERTPRGITVHWSDGYLRFLENPVACPTVPPPVVTPPPPLVEIPPPVNVDKVTCADLDRLNAGRKWYARLGCTPPPRTPPRRPMTCSYARAHYSPAVARQVLARRGISPNCLTPFVPPVMG